MALIACRECGKEISDQAAACPHCGMPHAPVPARPIPPPPAPPAKKSNPGCGTLIAFVVLLFIILAAVRSCADKVESPEASATPTAPTAPVETPEEAMARAVATMDNAEAARGDRLSAALRAIASEDRAVKDRAQKLADDLREEIRLESVGRQWTYSRHKDAMTSGESVQAVVRSSNTHDLGFPYAGPQRATLVVRRHPKHGNDIIFSIERGQLLCSTYGDCPVRLRFDENPARTLKGNEPADHSTETIFVPGYRDFVSRLTRSKKLLVEANIYQQGAPVWEFDVEGFKPDQMQ